MAQIGMVILPVNINVLNMVLSVVIAFLLVADSFHVLAAIAENVMAKFCFTSLTASVIGGRKPSLVFNFQHYESESKKITEENCP